MASAESVTSVDSIVQTVPERPRLLVLDGLRGIAVLLVLAFHFSWYPAGGWLGVDLFFVLSGYLITSTILHDVHSGRSGVFRPIDAGRFYGGRALRILPAMFEMFALYGAIKLLDPQKVTRFWDNINSTVFLYSNWSRALRWGYPDFLGHTWSLAIEEQFYLIWPVVLLLFLRSARGERALGGVVAAAIAVIAILRYRMTGAHPDFDRLYNGTDTRIDTILMGCLAALISQSDRFRKVVLGSKLSCSVISAMASAFIVWMFVNMKWQNPWFYRYGIPLFYVSGAAIVIHVCSFPNMLAPRLLKWTPLTFAGRRSYGIYLFHFPILIALNLIYGKMQGWECALLGVPPTFLLATLSWRYVEYPALQLKKRLFRFRETPEIGRAWTPENWSAPQLRQDLEPESTTDAG